MQHLPGWPTRASDRPPAMCTSISTCKIAWTKFHKDQTLQAEELRLQMVAGRNPPRDHREAPPHPGLGVASSKVGLGQGGLIAGLLPFEDVLPWRQYM